MRRDHGVIEIYIREKGSLECLCFPQGSLGVQVVCPPQSRYVDSQPLLAPARFSGLLFCFVSLACQGQIIWNGLKCVLPLSWHSTVFLRPLYGPQWHLLDSPRPWPSVWDRKSLLTHLFLLKQPELCFGCQRNLINNVQCFSPLFSSSEQTPQSLQNPCFPLSPLSTRFFIFRSH